MRTIQLVFLIWCAFFMGFSEVKAAGDLDVSGMTVTNDLVIANLNCT